MNPDFVRTPSHYHEVPATIAEIVPEFLASPEFRVLGPEDRSTPGLVCAAFSKYLVRRQQTVFGGTRSPTAENELDRCYLAIESLASSNEATIRNLVVVEIFENLHAENGLLLEILKRLGPASKALYDEWMR